MVGPLQSSGPKPGSTACFRKDSTKAAISAGVSPFSERAFRNSVLVAIASFSLSNASKGFGQFKHTLMITLYCDYSQSKMRHYSSNLDLNYSPNSDLVNKYQ